MNIGDNVKWKNEYDETMSGFIVNVLSDMDSYDEMRLRDGVPLYYSKKLGKFVTVFLEVVKGKNVCNEFIRFSSVA